MTRRTVVSVAVLVSVVLLGVFALQPNRAVASSTVQAQPPQLSLITETPDEGFALALTLARRGVSSTQTDRDVLRSLRPEYANDAASLIAASHVVAVHFQTIAEANSYWR